MAAEIPEKQPTFSISNKIQGGGRNLRNSTFFRGNIPKISNTQMVQTLLEITLCRTVFEIKDIFQRHYI